MKITPRIYAGESAQQLFGEREEITGNVEEKVKEIIARILRFVVDKSEDHEDFING